MHVLVINCGSSSIKAAVFDTVASAYVLRAKVQRLGSDSVTMELGEGAETSLGSVNHRGALDSLIPAIKKALGDETLDAVGHRVVHGGAEFSTPTMLDDDVLATLQALSPLAPLHNPANVAGIRAARAALPDVPHVAVFDTAFHATLPRRAREYALPAALRGRYRRYGFHGTSHAYVSKLAASHLHQDVRDLRLIVCHLGNGASAAAIEYGRSIETSMGMTPLEGLVMGTRSGDLDPGIVIALQRDEGMSLDEVDTLLNRSSGLAGLSGRGNDLRDIESGAADGDEDCRIALHVFCHRLRKYIGAYAAVMGGVDAIVFTGGIGENSALVRHRVCQRLEFLGARLDEDRNRDVSLSSSAPVSEFSSKSSRVQLLAVRTDEERAIAESTAALAAGHHRVQEELRIPVAVSARHVHLTQEAVEALFGEGATLTEEKPLSQPGQFAAHQRVTLIGPRRTIEGVRVLGPTRPKNQIEISTTDEFFLGLDAPVRASGDVANTPGITLEGPAGRLTLHDGVICAWRHIHMRPEDAEMFGVKDRDVVDVSVSSDGRDLVFGDVLVRVSAKYALEMHIDTDEANAAGIGRGAEGQLVSTNGEAHLTRRRTQYDGQSS